jgi:hypothetical protein
MTLSITCLYAERRNAECCVLFNVKHNVIVLNVIMPNAIMLYVVMPGVLVNFAAREHLKKIGGKK